MKVLGRKQFRAGLIENAPRRARRRARLDVGSQDTHGLHADTRKPCPSWLKPMSTTRTLASRFFPSTGRYSKVPNPRRAGKV